MHLAKHFDFSFHGGLRRCVLLATPSPCDSAVRRSLRSILAATLLTLVGCVEATTGTSASTTVEADAGRERPDPADTGPFTGGDATDAGSALDVSTADAVISADTSERDVSATEADTLGDALTHDAADSTALDSSTTADADASTASDDAAEDALLLTDTSDTTDRDAGTCATETAVPENGTRPVDIVWVIDGSPSMDDTIAIIEANVNAFAARIGASDLDYHVVLIGADRFTQGGAVSISSRSTSRL